MWVNEWGRVFWHNTAEPSLCCRGRMHRTFLIFGLLLPLMFVSPKAFACRCSTPAVHAAYTNARVIFEGEVIDDANGPACGPKKVLMRVDNTYKGLPRKEVYISVGEGCSGCAAHLVKGEKYIVFATGDIMNGLVAGGCGGTFNLKDEKSYLDSKDFIAEISKQMEMHELNIAAQPENADIFLRAEAEHLLYWHDDERAEVVLRKLIQHKSADVWSANALLGVLVRLQKPQELWDFFETLQAEDKSVFWNSDSETSLSYAVFSLGKEMDKNFRLQLDNVDFNGLQRPSVKSRGPIFTRVNMKSSNLSHSEFFGARIKDSTFTQTDFSGVLFGSAEIRNSTFLSANLTGADLTGASILNSEIFNVDLTNANLSGVILQGSRFSCDTIWPDGYDPIAAGATPTVKCENGLWSKVEKMLR